jgi:hypothetical protein
MSKVIINSAKATNVSGSESDRRSSWIAYWTEMTGRNAGTCAYFGCSNQADVGGHLFLARYSREYTYIAPICYSCNNQKDQDREYYDMKSNVAYIKIESIV